MLLTQPPECRSRFTNLIHNFFFTHKVVVHILLHTFLLHQDFNQCDMSHVKFCFVPAQPNPAG